MGSKQERGPGKARKYNFRPPSLPSLDRFERLEERQEHEEEMGRRIEALPEDQMTALRQWGLFVMARGPELVTFPIATEDSGEPIYRGDFLQEGRDVLKTYILDLQDYSVPPELTAFYTATLLDNAYDGIHAPRDQREPHTSQMMDYLYSQYGE